MQSDISLPSLALKEFEALTRRYALFHAAFFALFILELLTLLFFMPWFAKTVGVAIVVAVTFLTIFIYFVLRFYLESRKPEQLILLRDRFLSAADTPAQKMGQVWSVETLYPIYQLVQKLQEKEIECYKIPFLLQTLAPLIEKFSIWCHWEDVHWMRETLHLHALRKALDWVKLCPTDLELHKTLAGAYTALYQIYQQPSLKSSSYAFILRKYESAEMKERFEKAARSAVEELKVVLTYLPEDTWSLGQIAKVYHDLGLRQEEKKTYETLLSLQPQNPEIRYQLGKLYFELGHMAQGLCLYQELQEREDPKAKELIQHYDAYHNASL